MMYLIYEDLFIPIGFSFLDKSSDIEQQSVLV